MFWHLITKILVDVLADILVGVLVKLILTAGSALFANYRSFQQPSFA